jgi:hypothetical protein
MVTPGPELRTESTVESGDKAKAQESELARQVLEKIEIRDSRGRFAPGSKPGPGKPRLETLVRSAARAEGLKSIQTLIELRDTSRNEKVRMAAATALLDRGFGKPRECKEEESLDLSGDVELDAESLNALLSAGK